MSTTPEALRLAQIIEQFGGASAYQAAAELRRLAAVEAAIPSPAPAQPADERAAFEAWADKYPGLEDDHGYVNLRYLGLHKQYVDFDVQRAWTTWQARAALAAQAQAGPDGALEMLLAHRDGIPWGEVRSAFNAAIDRLNVAMAKEAHEATQAAAPCVCPSGDGSLRWPCPQHPPETAIPAGWTALRMERVPGHPETVAYGPAEAMERLRVELDAYHQGLKVDQYRASLPVVEPGAIQAPVTAHHDHP